MKFVTLLALVMTTAFAATAQTTSHAAKKRSVAKVQQKTKARKAVAVRSKEAASKNRDVTTLTDEKEHKAKWTFEEMLKRKMEVDAEESERLRTKQ